MNNTEKHLYSTQKYYENPKTCKYCGIILNYQQRRNTFCCKSHKASYTNSHRILSEQSKLERANKISKTLKANKTLKIKHCVICNRSFETYSNSAKYCSEHDGSKCPQCGSIKRQCKRPDICKKSNIFPTLEKYFGFDKSVIGTEKLYQEFERVANLLKEDYWDNKLSMPDMIQKYNYYNNPKNFYKILKSLNIKTRSLSESMRNAFFVGNRTLTPNFSSKYKHRLSHNVG